ncbi:hypothetical protein QBC39DRAFT_52566 [Podospora conica]|nr:hypothetical protein QBC39DRAFT_52566 [Schizothecium conicum]
MTKGRADVGSLILRGRVSDTREDHHQHTHGRFGAAFLGVAIGFGVHAPFSISNIIVVGTGCWDGPGVGGFGDKRCTQLKESSVSRRDTGRDALLDPLAMGGIGYFDGSAGGGRGVLLLVLLTPFGIFPNDNVPRGGGQEEGQRSPAVDGSSQLPLHLTDYASASRWYRSGPLLASPSWAPNQRCLDNKPSGPSISQQGCHLSNQHPVPTDSAGQGRVHTCTVSCWTTTLERHAYIRTMPPPPLSPMTTHLLLLQPQPPVPSTLPTHVWVGNDTRPSRYNPLPPLGWQSLRPVWTRTDGSTSATQPPGLVLFVCPETERPPPKRTPKPNPRHEKHVCPAAAVLIRRYGLQACGPARATSRHDDVPWTPFFRGHAPGT